jgi:hypothetical protein
MHVGVFSLNRSCGGNGVGRIVGWTLGGIILAVLFGFLFGWVVQLLWNWLMPELFHLKPITYWQGFGIVLLAKILFGCHIGHHAKHPHRHWKGRQMDWKNWGGGDDWKDDTWKPRGSYGNWKYYDQYWREEGKAAFESYIERVEKERKS